MPDVICKDGLSKYMMVDLDRDRRQGATKFRISHTTEEVMVHFTAPHVFVAWGFGGSFNIAKMTESDYDSFMKSARKRSAFPTLKNMSHSNIGKHVSLVERDELSEELGGWNGECS